VSTKREFRNRVTDKDTLFPTVGIVLYDMGRVLKNPGFVYWKQIFVHASSVFAKAAPLSLWLCFFTGTAMTIQTSSVLSMVGAERGLSAVLIGSTGLREIAVMLSLFGISASVGAGFVTELGAMRISDEIDGLEVMAIPSHPYLMSTRMIGAVIATIPLIVFSIGAVLGGAWIAALSQRPALSIGSFEMFFWKVITPIDIFYSVIKGVTITIFTAAISLSTGYRATGGPVGVSLAVGRALNLSVTAGILANLAFSYFFWGTRDTVTF